jgi:hypothetical protein
LVEGAFVVPVRPRHLESLTTKAPRRSRSIRRWLKKRLFRRRLDTREINYRIRSPVVYSFRNLIEFHNLLRV